MCQMRQPYWSVTHTRWRYTSPAGKASHLILEFMRWLFTVKMDTGLMRRTFPDVFVRIFNNIQAWLLYNNSYHYAELSTHSNHNTECATPSAECPSHSPAGHTPTVKCLTLSAECPSNSPVCHTATVTCLTPSVEWPSHSPACHTVTVTCLTPSVECPSHSPAGHTPTVKCFTLSSECPSYSPACHTATVKYLTPSVECPSHSPACHTSTVKCITPSAKCPLPNDQFPTCDSKCMFHWQWMQNVLLLELDVPMLNAPHPSSTVNAEPL